jgi:hypothetical protein
MNKMVLTLMIVAILGVSYMLLQWIKRQQFIDLFSFGFIGISLFFIIGLTLAILKDGQET